MMRKILDNQTRNDLQMSHAITIYLVLKKLSGKKEKKHFWLTTLKLLTLQFQFRKILGGQEPPLNLPPSLLPPQLWLCKISHYYLFPLELSIFTQY